MKNLILRILSPIAFLVSLVLPFRVFYLIKLFKDLVFSFSVKRTLGMCGRNFFIEYPATLHGSQNIYIGKNFYSFGRLRLETFQKHLNNTFTPELLIGNNVSINFDCHIGCINKIIIEDNVLIASKVFISDHSHGFIDESSLNKPPSARSLISKGPVIIKKNVWIGEGVVILPDVTIGENSIIGANAVVTKDIPPNSVAAGNPAKIIKSFLSNS